MSYLRYPASSGEKDACAGSYGTSGAANRFTTATDPGILFEYGPRRTAVWCDVWHPMWGATPNDCVDIIIGAGAIASARAGNELCTLLSCPGGGIASAIRHYGCPAGGIGSIEGVYQLAKNMVAEFSFEIGAINADTILGFAAAKDAGGTDYRFFVDLTLSASANFRLYARNNGAMSAPVDTGVTPAIDTRYYLRFLCSSTSVDFWFGTTYAGMTYRASITDELPTANLSFRALVSTGAGLSAQALRVFDVRAYQEA